MNSASLPIKNLYNPSNSSEFVIFHQQHFNRTTHLELREHGLYLSQRNGQTRLDTELAYEELLPMQLERRRTLSVNQIGGRFLWWGLLIAANLARPLLPREGIADETWLLLFGAGAALIGLYFYGSYYWWNHLIISMARATIVLPDGGPANRRRVAAFAHALEKRTKSYLRAQHAQINPLGIIEPQLRRLRWLHHLDVLSEAEAQALTTRLTGRRGSPELRGMGQRLEAPYLN